MTSAAYGVGGHSIADGVAVDCQVSAFFAPSEWPKGLPGEESRTRHVPSNILGALGFERLRGANPYFSQSSPGRQDMRIKGRKS